MSKRESLAVIVTVRIAPTDFERMKALAWQERRSVSSWLRWVALNAATKPNQKDVSMIYATKDSEGGRIAENALIHVFDTEAEAREWLLRNYDGADWNLDTARIEAGRFGDCWIKSYSTPKREGDKLIAGLCDFQPFRADQLSVAEPGQHPGGKMYWIEPSEPVLVVAHIEERSQ